MSTGCFPGCADVRYGVRVIAILDFWIGVLLLVNCLSELSPYYVLEYSSREYISYVGNVFVYLFVIFLFLYINYHLKDSTYDHKVYKTYQWLSINTMFLAFHIVAVTYIVILSHDFRMIYYSMPICFVHSCQIYLVKYFYDEQMVRSFAAVNAAFNNNDRTITITADGRQQFHRVHGTIRQQTAAAATGPQQIRYAADPATVVYPRLDEGGHPSAPSSTGQHQYAAQEYCNPPPYTPDYGVHIGNNHL